MPVARPRHRPQPVQEVEQTAPHHAAAAAAAGRPAAPVARRLQRLVQHEEGVEDRHQAAGRAHGEHHATDHSSLTLRLVTGLYCIV